MRWHFINSGFNSGEFNMNYDLHLAENSETGTAIFRIYRWNPYCISLGANQNTNSINILKAEKDKIDIVKRPTGGRAILHSEELTYSVIYPADADISPRQLYNEINLALKSGLIIYNPVFNKIELEKTQPDFGSFYHQKVSELCFAASAKSELKFNGKKIVGSAQRKMDNAILQHGSILCGSHHLRIVDYINYPIDEIDSLRTKIAVTTTDISSILDEEVNYELLISSLELGLEQHFKMNFKNLPSSIEKSLLAVLQN